MRTFSMSPFNTRFLAADLWHDMDEKFSTHIYSDTLGAVYDERSYGLACDVTEHAEHFHISLDVPGMRPEDIKAEVKDNVLTVSGNRQKESVKSTTPTRQLQEKFYGLFKRTFTLPKKTDADRIQASYENGVLELVIPKTPEEKPKTIQIETERKGFLGKLLSSAGTEEKKELA